MKFVRSLFRRPEQREILITRRTLAVSSACLLSLGIGGVVYKEWQTQSQGQVQINNCYFVPTPLATPTPAITAKPMPKTVTLPESA